MIKEQAGNHRALGEKILATMVSQCREKMSQHSD